MISAAGLAGSDSSDMKCAKPSADILINRFSIRTSSAASTAASRTKSVRERPRRSAARSIIAMSAAGSRIDMGYSLSSVLVGKAPSFSCQYMLLYCVLQYSFGDNQNDSGVKTGIAMAPASLSCCPAAYRPKVETRAYLRMVPARLTIGLLRIDLSSSATSLRFQPPSGHDGSGIRLACCDSGSFCCPRIGCRLTSPSSRSCLSPACRETDRTFRPVRLAACSGVPFPLVPWTG